MEACKQKGVDLEEVARRNFYELAFSHCRQGWGAEGRARPPLLLPPCLSIIGQEGLVLIFSMLSLCCEAGWEKALCASLGS